jgi:hypothetical protein
MAVKIKIRPSAKAAGSKSPTTATRKALAANDQAMPDGSFPIPNLDFLKRAIRSIGRTPPGKRASVVAWIKKRASALGQPKLAANLSNLADSALLLANALDAVELAGTIVTPPHLTPGARSQGSGKGKIPAVPDKGSGASKKPPKSAPAGSPLKSAKAKAMYSKLCAKGIDKPTALKAARKLDQGLNVDEMSNPMPFPPKGKAKAASAKDADGDYDGDNKADVAAKAKLGLKNKKSLGAYTRLRKAGKPHPVALMAAKMLDKKLGDPTKLAGSPKA